MISLYIHLKINIEATSVVIATGYYDHPNYMNIPGENLQRYFIILKKHIHILISDVVVIGLKIQVLMQHLNL